jgi:hypothetical protein
MGVGAHASPPSTVERKIRAPKHAYMRERKRRKREKTE